MNHFLCKSLHKKIKSSNLNPRFCRVQWEFNAGTKELMDNNKTENNIQTKCQKKKQFPQGNYKSFI
jgi:hypothetical protein